MRTFLFAPTGVRPLALVRIGTGLVLGYDAARHWPYAVELYSLSGPSAPLFPEFHAPTPEAATAIVMQSLLVFFLARVAAGWHTRISLWGALFLALWLWPLDRLGTFAKHVLLGMHLLFLLGWSGCGAVWSVDERGQAGSRESCPVRAVWPQRLMQLLVCGMYLQAAVTKLRSPSFMNGHLLSFSLLDNHWGGGSFGMWLASLPHVPMLLSLGTVLYELLFPFLVWVPNVRLFLLGVGVIVHLTMGVAMHVGIFTPIMLVALLAFLNERDVAWVQKWLGRGWGASGGENAVTERGDTLSMRRNCVLYLITGVVCAAAGLFCQRRTDAYGVFGRRPLDGPRILPAGDVSTLLRAQLPPLANVIHRVRLGERFGGQDVFGSDQTFRMGRRVYVLAQFNVPHETFSLEGLLIGPDGQELTRFERQVETSRMEIVEGFELTGELLPGTYQIILQIDGYEVGRRRIEVVK